MNHLAFLFLLFLFVFLPLFVMALCLVSKRQQFLGHGVNKWRDDFDSDAIRSSYPTTAAMQVAGEFPKTAPNGLAVPGCSESQTAPKGLGSEVNKPLMKKPRAPLVYERHADRDTAGNTFAAIRRSILLKILTSPLLPTRITQKPVGPRLTGLLFCSGTLKKI